MSRSCQQGLFDFVLDCNRKFKLPLDEKLVRQRFNILVQSLQSKSHLNSRQMVQQIFINLENFQTETKFGYEYNKHSHIASEALISGYCNCICGSTLVMAVADCLGILDNFGVGVTINHAFLIDAKEYINHQKIIIFETTTDNRLMAMENDPNVFDEGYNYGDLDFIHDPQAIKQIIFLSFLQMYTKFGRITNTQNWIFITEMNDMLNPLKMFQILQNPGVNLTHPAIIYEVLVKFKNIFESLQVFRENSASIQEIFNTFHSYLKSFFQNKNQSIIFDQYAKPILKMVRILEHDLSPILQIYLKQMEPIDTKMRNSPSTLKATQMERQADYMAYDSDIIRYYHNLPNGWTFLQQAWKNELEQSDLDFYYELEHLGVQEHQQLSNRMAELGFPEKLIVEYFNFFKHKNPNSNLQDFIHHLAQVNRDQINKFLHDFNIRNED